MAVSPEIAARLNQRLDRIEEQQEEKAATEERPKRLGMVARIESRKIRDASGKVIDFTLRKAQKQLAAWTVMLEKLGLPRRFVLLKSRKLGMSSLVQAIHYDKANQTPNRLAQLLAHKATSTHELFKIPLLIHREIPQAERKPLYGDRDNQKILRFEAPHSSEIVPQTAGSSEVGRGGTPQDYHASEVAFWERDRENWIAGYTAVPVFEDAWDTSAYAESTANGTGNVFHKLWQESAHDLTPFQIGKKIREIWCAWQLGQKEMPWIGLFFSWKDDPRYAIPILPGENFVMDEREKDYAESEGLSPEQVKWARRIRVDNLYGSWEAFHQEHPVSPDLAFKFSGRPMFDQEALKRDKERAEKIKPIFRGEIQFEDAILPKAKLIENPYGKLEIWEYPKPGEKYAIGGDFGEGIGSDYTEIQVYKGYEVVAYYYSNSVTLTEASEICYLLGCYYNWALMGVERNNVGGVVVTKLLEDNSDYPQWFPYPNLYAQVSRDSITEVISKQFGFATTQKTKRQGLTLLQHRIHQGATRFNSLRIIAQLMGFGINPAMSGRYRYQQKEVDPITREPNDDAVMAAMIGVSMVDEVMKNSIDEMETEKW